MDKQPQHRIEAFGFDKQFYYQEIEKSSPFIIARITSARNDRFSISDGSNEIFAEISGKLLLKTESVFDYPAVADWILVHLHNEDTFAIIHSVLPRKSLFRRKMPGRKIDFQLIAGNIDTAFIIQALDFHFGPG